MIVTEKVHITECDVCGTRTTTGSFTSIDGYDLCSRCVAIFNKVLYQKTKDLVQIKDIIGSCKCYVKPLGNHDSLGLFSYLNFDYCKTTKES